MIILGIETSCDETAAAVVRDDRAILGESLFSQLDAHRAYGGVVPEIAARAHLERIRPIVTEALEKAGIGFDGIDAVAATGGPGLIGGVLVGTMLAKAIALVRGLPYVAVNHLEGHALTARLTDGLEFPYLLLLVSGGHCQLVGVEGVGQYRLLGATIDDAAGEAFDKSAKMLGLGYPGGPALERAAKAGDPKAFALPRPLVGRAGCDFSFSGLKAAVRRTIIGLPEGPLSDQTVADMSASFQAAVADILVDRTRRAIAMFPAPALVVAGGVAANQALRAALGGLANANGMRLVAPPLRLCTDNAPMIAWAGLERLRLGQQDDLDFKPRPRWPLVSMTGMLGNTAQVIL